MLLTPLLEAALAVTCTGPVVVAAVAVPIALCVAVAMEVAWTCPSLNWLTDAPLSDDTVGVAWDTATPVFVLALASGADGEASVEVDDEPGTGTIDRIDTRTVDVDVNVDVMGVTVVLTGQ